MKKFRQWLRDFLGISIIITKAHNIEGDVNSIMTKQLDEIDPLPVDPPECDKNSPYQYLTKADMAEEGGADSHYGWYIIWIVGFAGPFKTERQANKYGKNNEIKRFYTEKLCPIPFKIK